MGANESGAERCFQCDLYDHSDSVGGGGFLGANLCQRNHRPNVDSDRKLGSRLVGFEWSIKKPSYARGIAAGIGWRYNFEFQETSYRLIGVRPPVFRFPYGLKEISESAATGGVN